MNRRSLLTTTGLMTAGAGIALTVAANETHATSSPTPTRLDMHTIKTNDGTQLYAKEWGTGAPVVLVHSWALNGDMWQYQTAEFANHGLRCITYDRRGHGCSDHPSSGYDTNTLADDLAKVMDSLDVSNAVLIGHSMGCGEIVRYLARHGSRRVARIVLLAPTTPYLKQTPDNPDGIPEQAFEAVRAAWMADFPQWIADNTAPFFTKDTSTAMQVWATSMMERMSLPIAVACNRSMVDTDFRADLRDVTTPTLLIHGDADASAPLPLTGARTAKLLPNCTFKIYEGAPHGLFLTHRQRLNADILQFIGA